MKPKLLIVGASVRAQVESSIRAGYPVEGWDLFADHDTRAACELAGSTMAVISKIESFDDIVGAVANAKSISESKHPDIAIVCGGVEQHAEAMAAIEGWLPVAGCSAESSAMLTHRERLHEAFEAAGCLVAPTFERLPDDATPADWLLKPLRSSGGMGIRTAVNSDRNECETSPVQYFQERIDGQSCSSVFVAKNGHAALVGSTRQLVGDSRFTDSPFAWCGSIGPIGLHSDSESRLIQLGNVLAESFTLQGLFGVDFILNDSGIWPVDINARIPGSAEIFESFSLENHRPSAFNMIEAQLGQLDFAWSLPRTISGSDQICGKAIVFNQTNRGINVSDEVFEGLLAINQTDIRISDIPGVGTEINPGDPITTVQMTGAEQKDVESTLVSAAQRVRECWR